VIFDFDGTLADSEKLLVELVLDALARAGLRVALAPDEIARLIGLPLVQVLASASGTPADAMEEVVRLYRGRADADDVIARFRLFPRVRPTLAALAARGKRLAIATSKSRAVTERIAAAVGLGDLITDIVGGDSVERGKPHPEAVLRLLAAARCRPDKAAVIGDTTYDIEMGKGAGARTIAATYGMHARSTLASFEPDAFIDDVAELVGGWGPEARG